jgi:hypothetical protein
MSLEPEDVTVPMSEAPEFIDLSPEEATGIPQLMGETKKLFKEYLDLQSYMMTKDEDTLGYSVSERRCNEIEKSLTPRQLRVFNHAAMLMMNAMLDRGLDALGIFGGHQAERYFRE